MEPEAGVDIGVVRHYGLAVALTPIALKILGGITLSSAWLAFPIWGFALALFSLCVQIKVEDIES